jgi:hypothetical protein
MKNSIPTGPEIPPITPPAPDIPPAPGIPPGPDTPPTPDIPPGVPPVYAFQGKESVLLVGLVGARY